MRGTISLDLLLSFIVMLIISSAVLGMSFVQLENSAIASAQYKADALAIGVGSAINHFRAIRSEEGFVNLTLGDVGIRSSRIGQEGWPDVFAIDFKKCTMQVDGNVFWLNFTIHRVENNVGGYINATYPLVDVFLAPGQPLYSTCDKTLGITYDGVVTYA